MTPHKVELRTLDDMRILMRHDGIENNDTTIPLNHTTLHLTVIDAHLHGISKEDLAMVIRTFAAHLKHLDLLEAIVPGDMTPIFMALLDCTNLEVLKVFFNDGQEVHFIPSILQRKPMLKEINFVFEDNQPGFKNFNNFLCGGDHFLEKVTLDFGNELDETEVVELFRSVAICPTIKELHFAFSEQKITARGTAAIGELIARSKSLKFLRIDPVVSINPVFPHQGFRRLAETLAANETLERLHLGFFPNEPSSSLDYSDLLPIARALRHHNSTLQEFLIKRNESHYKEVQFFCHLNKIGRGKLLGLGGENQMAPMEEWVETIISNRDDLSVIFYLLQKNPSLIKYVADEVSLCIGALEKGMDLLGKIPSNLTANQEALLAAQMEKVKAALAAYEAASEKKNSQKVGHCEAVGDVVEASNDDNGGELPLQVPPGHNAGWKWGPLQMPPIRFFKKKKTGGEESSSVGWFC